MRTALLRQFSAKIQPHLRASSIGTTRPYCEDRAQVSDPDDYCIPPGLVGGTYNDLPSPEGDWYKANAADQGRRNIVFIAGLGTFLGTLAFGFAFDMFNGHTDIPLKPAVIDSYRRE